MKTKLILGLMIAMFAFATLSVFPLGAAAIPNGANVTKHTSSSLGGGAHDPTFTDAFAGNTTELVIQGYSNTQSWQGYYGNVTGLIELGDANNNTFYNWTGLSNPTGEVYASVNDTITWSYTQCFNITANGTYGDDSDLAGGVNLGGANSTHVDTEYNIAEVDGDGINDTFNDIFSHTEFTTAGLTFSAGECLAITTEGTADFEEVLLYEPVSTSVIFAALIQQDGVGFDGAAHDFQMLVLEDGHSGDTSGTNYYFFTEL